jgi:endonuclease/exonuclease/phosphatase family metal-dependent hydrolase
MWAVDPTRWSALTALALAATVFALACGERSAERPDAVANKSEDGKSEETRSLKVMSANIYLGGRKDRPGLNGIARYVGCADVVLLQEVDKGSAEALARKSGLENFRFTKDEGMRVGEYGVATLSRLPLGATQVYTLPETAQGYDVILRTEARVAERSVTLVNAFYPAGYDKEGRSGRLEATRLVLGMLERTEGPLVLGGDLNATHDGAAIRRLAAEMTDSFKAVLEDRYHCEEPFGRIDYVFFRGPFTTTGHLAGR